MTGDSANSGSFSDTMGLYGQAVKELPSAAADFAKEAWDHKAATAQHVLETGISSVALGTALGYILPAKGPAAWIVGAAFTVPMVVNATKGLIHARDESMKDGADRDAIARGLAKSTVEQGFDFGLNMVGGYYGTELGVKLAHRNDGIGATAQAGQRFVLDYENKGMLKVRDTFFSRATEGPTKTDLGLPKNPIDTLTNEGPGLFNRDLDSQLIKANTPADIEPEHQGWLMRPFSKMGRRLDQYNLVNTQLERTLGDQQMYGTYRGTLHAHTVFDDGMGYPKDIYAQAKQEGLEVLALTPHNHDGARQGVPAGDPRAEGQSKVPILAKTPAEYGEIINAAEAATEPGKFVGMYGIEMGTIGPSGHSGGGHGGGHGHGEAGAVPESGIKAGTGAADDSLLGLKDKGTILGTTDHNANGPVLTDAKPSTITTQADGHIDGHTHGIEDLQAVVDPKLLADPVAAAQLTHHGGVNHINAFGIRDTLIVADRAPKGVMGFIYRLAGRDPVKVPDVVHYPDGNYAELADIFANHKDVTGENVIVQLNHPRFRTNGDTDYGVASFKNRQEWLTKFADPFVRLQEIVKGEALNPDPIPNMKPGDVDPLSFAGYMDMGVHAGPTFGRDSHFGNPGGRPAGTGIVAKALDEPSVFEALRNRRTFATTNYEYLQGVLTANDRFYMGSILDQAAVPDVNLKVKIGGKIEPDAEYVVKLLGDEKIGDGNLAQSIQEKTVKGSDLLNSDGQVAFDPVNHKLGNKSAYFVEINRTGPSSDIVDKMWTSPIWIEPLSGAKHSLLTRWLVGSGSNYFTPTFEQALR